MVFTEYPIVAFEDTQEQVRKMRAGVGLVLNQQGIVNDLSYQVNRHRRDMGYSVSDRITLEIGVSAEVWWAIYFNMEEFKRKTLVNHVRFQPVEALVNPDFVEVELGDKSNVFVVAFKSYK